MNYYIPIITFAAGIIIGVIIAARPSLSEEYIKELEDAFLRIWHDAMEFHTAYTSDNRGALGTWGRRLENSYEKYRALRNQVADKRYPPKRNLPR